MSETLSPSGPKTSPSQRRRALGRNIPLHLGFLSLTAVNLTQGLWMIFLALRGYSLTQLGLLEGAFHLTSFLMEIPTGIVADLWGRKASRLLGRVSFFISMALMFWGGAFWVQLIGFIFCGLSYNLESGAGEALAYDTLKELGSEDRYRKLAAAQNLIFEAGAVISFLVGGAAATWLGYQWVFVPTMILTGASLLMGALWTEPRGDDEAAAEVSDLRQMGWLRGLAEQMKRSLGVIRRVPRLAFLVLFSELILMFYTCLYYYLQTFWKASGWNEFSVQAVLAGASVFSALAGLRAESLERRLGPRRMILLVPLVLVLMMTGVALMPQMPLFFMVMGGLEGFLYVSVSDLVNRSIPSAQRATVISFQSMVFSFYMILLFPLIGLAGDAWGMGRVFGILALMSGVLYLFFLFFSLLFLNKKSS